MRRIDKLILKAFIGPFFLTTGVATFILLIQYMLKYFDDFVGKDLGFAVFAELIFYFSLNMLQVALPLGVLVSSLMTFGNLGEHFELTAIKGAGISLLRTMRAIFIFVVLLSFWAFWFNNTIVPAANLKAYSLLYDIKHTKPALDIKAGVFYNGIPNYSIKVSEKLSDNKTLLDVIIYDHSERQGNKRVILADSSRMFTIYNDKFLKLELYNGNYFIEEDKPRSRVDQFFRTSYDRMDMVFPLSSFDLKRTKEELFRNNRQMKNIAELTTDIDSLQLEIEDIKYEVLDNGSNYLPNNLREISTEMKREMMKKNQERINKKNREKEKKQQVEEASFLSFPYDFYQDTSARSLLKKSMLERKRPMTRIDSTLIIQNAKDSLTDSLTIKTIDEKINTEQRKRAMVASNALRQARNFKVNINSQKVRMENLQYERNKYAVEKYKKYSQAFACIVMFLIGAPLGAIIKRGGLGVPVIISILFFIIYYVLTISSEKWAKAGLIEAQYAVWTADIILLPVGLFFLRQARIDARLFDTDFYLVVADKFKQAIGNLKK